MRACADDSWSASAREGGSTPSPTIDGLLAQIPGGRPLIIKLDIEGAERVVVAASPQAFAETKCIFIEPHDFLSPGSNCLTPLFRFAGERAFDTLVRGENLLLISSS